MGNYYPPFSLRTSEETIGKMKYIAKKHHRSANSEMEVALEQYIADYEAVYGPIQLPEE